MLIGASEVVDWIDWLRGPDLPMPEREPVPLLRLEYASRTYLTSAPWAWRLAAPPCWIEEFFDHPHWWHIARRWRQTSPLRNDAGLGWFALEEKGGAEFLNGLSRAINGGTRQMPSSFALPIFDPVGFGISDEDRGVSARRDDGGRAYDYARFRDGLALLGDPFRGRPRDVVLWSPDGGLSLG